MGRYRARNNDSGVALLMVIFIIALATSLVVGLTHSTFLQSRSIGMVERQLQSEYLLKSMVEFSAAVIDADADTQIDSFHDVWGKFRDGSAIPAEILEALGINLPGVQVALEIVPANSKIKLRNSSLTKTSGQVDKDTKDMVVRLFEKLGFANDDEEDHTSYFKGTKFDHEQMLVNLIDALDSDKEPYNQAGYPQGLEDRLPEDYLPNTVSSKKGGFRTIRQLGRIPGFTPNRLRKLIPFVTLDGKQKVNINVASQTVLESLHPDVAEHMPEIQERLADPDNPLNDSDFAQIVIPSDQTAQAALKSLVFQNSSHFFVIGKVAFGTSSSHYIRALLVRMSGEIGEVKDLVFF